MTTPAADAPSSPFLRWSWQGHDAHRAVTVVALLGVVGAVVMAIAGLPPVDLHGSLHYIGIMDPLCGGTRSARYTMLGELALAWKYNPLGIFAVTAAVTVAGRAVVGFIAGRWLTVAIAWTPRRRRLVIGLILAAAAVLELRQQLLANLLTGP